MDKSFKQGYKVVFAGFGMNLAFGVLYAWSIFAKQLIDQYHWNAAQATMPYTTAIAIFAMAMIPAGKLQDKVGARKIGTLGGLLTGTGLILSSFFTTPIGLFLSFGLLCGAGIGLGYASATPVAIKWFPSEKKGIITGIVVSGFGLSTLYMAPLANYLTLTFTMFGAFCILGIAFIFIVIGLAQFLIPPDSNPQVASLSKTAQLTLNTSRQFKWQEMIKTPIFYVIWFIFVCGALGGLMIIGHLSKITALQSGQNFGFILVAFTALFNASGRPIAGFVSDKLGRFKTLGVLFAVASITFFNFSHLTTFSTLLIGAAIVTFSYGSLFAIMPSLISDYFGKLHLGVNYGILFSAWGIGGVAGPMLASRIADQTGSYLASYQLAGTLGMAACLCSLTTHMILTRKKASPQVEEMLS